MRSARARRDACRSMDGLAWTTRGFDAPIDWHRIGSRACGRAPESAPRRTASALHVNRRAKTTSTAFRRKDQQAILFHVIG